ncbi:MAG: hypothetical protein IKG67_09240 [Parasporobacterium sp.]|nr:hypothetical protein [Parasporobacterium sp.]
MKRKQWLKVILFIICASLVVFLASGLLCVANEKDAVGIYGFYKEPKDSLDVVLIGSSAVYTSYYPPLAYEEQGITSYSLSTSTMTAPLYRYAAEIAIERQHPQLLVFETWSFCYENQQDETSLRKFLDALPDQNIRQRAIEDIVPEELRDSFRNPFQKYHSNWDRFGELVQVFRDKIDMNRKGYSVTKNFGTTPFIQPFRNTDEEYHVSENGLYYLQILLDYLKEADIDNVLFIRTPEMSICKPTDSYHQMIDMIREAGFDFLNLNAAAKDMGIDVTHDFYNTTHLNIFGAEKYTRFLADYIVKRYDLKTEHEDAVCREWEECASYNAQILPYVEELTSQNANGFLYTQRDFLH